jgi:hypothetical protein
MGEKIKKDREREREREGEREKQRKKEGRRGRWKVFIQKNFKSLYSPRAGAAERVGP